MEVAAVVEEGEGAVEEGEEEGAAVAVVVAVPQVERVGRPVRHLSPPVEISRAPAARWMPGAR